jgi:hypothetical protein
VVDASQRDDYERWLNDGKSLIDAVLRDKDERERVAESRVGVARPRTLLVGALPRARLGRDGRGRRGARARPTQRRAEMRGAFCALTLVPIRPRRRGERRFLRTLSPGVSLRPPLGFDLRPRRLSTPLLTPFNSTPTSLRMDPRP